MAINLPSDIEERARVAAARQGMDTDTFVAEAVEKELRYLGEKEAPVSQNGEAPEGKTLAVLFDGLIGGFHFGDAHLSENTGEKFAALLEEKRRQGHL